MGHYTMPSLNLVALAALHQLAVAIAAAC